MSTGAAGGDDLGSALALAADRLETGDLQAAAAAMTLAAAACSTQERLTPERVADARRLFARCQTAEQAMRRKLVHALEQQGNGRRADAAYDR
jgi:hypothetical protein